MTDKRAAAAKIRVGVVMGGVSSEREVSLESGRNIFSKFDRGKYDPIPIFMDSEAALWEIPLKLLMRNSTRDIEEDLAAEAQRIPYEALKARVDVVCLGLHGKYGEDGCIQGLLELLRIPYTGSGVLASALGMDKWTGRKVLSLSGVDVPRTVPVFKRQWDAAARTASGTSSGNPEGSERVPGRLIAAGIGFPCIVKPTREGCSTAVAKVSSPEELPAALDAAFVWDDTALVEEFLTGMEVTCGVIGNDSPEALTPSETIPTTAILSLEDKFLYGQGENKTPARLPDETLQKIREVAVRTFQSLDLKGYARIDLFVTREGRVVVLEPNSLPGMTPSTVLFHQAAAAGVTQSGLIDRIIQYALEAHAHKKGPL
jgi:D-alanine-D-alanine ligase